MSYCNQDLSLGFGTLPGNAIRQDVSQADCLPYLSLTPWFREQTPETLRFCNGLAQTLRAQACQGCSYRWYRNAEPIADATQDSFTVREAGSYFFLVQNDSCSAFSPAVSVEILPTPRPFVIQQPQGPVCPFTPLTLTAQGGSLYRWNFGGQAEARTGNRVEMQPAATGTYTLTASIGTCTAQTQGTIEVRNPPQVSILNPAPLEICSQFDTTLRAQGAQSYFWSAPDANDLFFITNPEAQNPAAYAAYTTEPHSLTCFVVGTDEFGCKDTASLSVDILPEPIIVFSADPLEACQNQDAVIEFHSPGNPDAVFQWDDGFPIFENRYSVFNFPNTFSYSYLIYATDAKGCIGTSVFSAFARPQPVVSATPQGALICPDSALTLNADGAVSWQWTPENLLDGSQTQSPVFRAEQAGAFTFQVVGTSEFGCRDTVELTVNVRPKPVIETASLCPDSTGLNIRVSVPDALISFDQGQSWNEPGDFLLPAGTVAITAKFTEPPHCAAPTSVQVFDTMAFDFARIAPDSFAVRVSGGRPPFSFRVFNRSGFDRTQESDSVFLIEAERLPDTFFVQVAYPLDGDARCASVRAFRLQPPTSRPDARPEAFRLYPNPGSAGFTLEGDFSAASQVQVFDLNGRRVAEIRIEQPQGRVQVNAETWANGLYFVRVSNLYQTIKTMVWVKG